MEKDYKSFSEFYSFHFTEHNNKTNWRLHFFGTLLVILILVFTVATQKWVFLILAPIFGYGFAWVSHFRIEKINPQLLIILFIVLPVIL